MNEPDLSDAEPTLATSLRICMDKGVGRNGTPVTQGTIAREIECTTGAVGHWRTGYRKMDKKWATRLFRVFAVGDGREISHSALDFERLKLLGRALNEHVSGFDDEAIRQSALEALENCNASKNWLEQQRDQMKTAARAEDFWAYVEPTPDEESSYDELGTFKQDQNDISHGEPTGNHGTSRKRGRDAAKVEHRHIWTAIGALAAVVAAVFAATQYFVQATDATSISITTGDGSPVNPGSGTQININSGADVSVGATIQNSLAPDPADDENAKDGK